MARIGIETSSERTIVTIGDLTIDLTELRRRSALAGKETKVDKGIDSGTERRKPGEGQMRWKDGSYLSVDEAADETFQRDMDIA